MRWRVAVRNGKAREASTALWETVGAMLGRINVAACPLFSASSHVMLHSRFFIFIASLNRVLFSLIRSYYYIKNSLHIVDTHTRIRLESLNEHFICHPNCLPASGTVAILTTFVKAIWRVHKFSRNPEPCQHFLAPKARHEASYTLRTHILDATVQDLVAWAYWRPGICAPLVKTLLISYTFPLACSKISLKTSDYFQGLLNVQGDTWTELSC